NKDRVCLTERIRRGTPSAAGSSSAAVRCRCRPCASGRGRIRPGRPRISTPAAEVQNYAALPQSLDSVLRDVESRGGEEALLLLNRCQDPGPLELRQACHRTRWSGLLFRRWELRVWGAGLGVFWFTSVLGIDTLPWQANGSALAGMVE